MLKVAALKKFYKNNHDPEVIEHETEREDSNLAKVDAKRLKFITNYNGTPYKSGGYEVITETTARHYCKNCGLKLKNIPQVNFRCIYGGVLCVRCAIAIGEDAKRAWNAIPKAERDNIESELFVHNLG